MPGLPDRHPICGHLVGHAYKGTLELTSNQTVQSDEETHDTVETADKRSVESGTEGSLKASMTGVGANLKGYFKGKVSRSNKSSSSNIHRETEAAAVSQTVRIETVNNAEEADRIGCQDPDCQYNDDRQKIELANETGVDSDVLNEVFDDSELTERSQQYLDADRTTAELEGTRSRTTIDPAEPVGDPYQQSHTPGRSASPAHTEQDNQNEITNETNDRDRDPATESEATDDSPTGIEEPYRGALTGKLTEEIENEVNQEIDQVSSLDEIRKLNDTIDSKIDEKVDDLDGFDDLDEESKQEFKRELREDLTGRSTQNENETRNEANDRDTEADRGVEAGDIPEDVDPIDEPERNPSEAGPDSRSNSNSNDSRSTETDPTVSSQSPEEDVDPPANTPDEHEGHIPPEDAEMKRNDRENNAGEANQRQTLPNSSENTNSEQPEPDPTENGQQNDEHKGHVPPEETEAELSNRGDNNRKEAEDSLSEDDAKINPRPDRELDDDDRYIV